MNTIYQTIKELRIIHNKTQTDIADALNIETSAYGKLERGNTEITLKKLEIIAAYFNMSVTDLIAYPKKLVCADSIVKAEIEEKVTITVELKKEKKEQALKLVFGEHNLDVLRK